VFHGKTKKKNSTMPVLKTCSSVKKIKKIKKRKRKRRKTYSSHESVKSLGGALGKRYTLRFFEFI